MKVLFLDIDGPINSGRWTSENHKRRMAAPRREGGAFAKEFCFPMGHIDPYHVGVLNSIIEATKCEVVLSSTWRKNHDLEEINHWFQQKGFKYQMIGQTIDLAIGGCRGYEIHQWLNEHPETESFVVLDDDGDMHHLLPWTVYCPHQTGLTEKEAEIAIRLLNNPKESMSESYWIHRFNYFDCPQYSPWENS